MNVGDTVVFTGTIKDIVRDKTSSAVSVLTGATDLNNPTASDGKEYWFQEQNLKVSPTATELEAMATAAGFKLEKIPPATAPGAPTSAPGAPAHTGSTAHTAAKH